MRQAMLCAVCVRGHARPKVIAGGEMSFSSVMRRRYVRVAVATYGVYVRRAGAAVRRNAKVICTRAGAV